MWKHVVVFVDVERHQPADGRDAIELVEEEPLMFRERHQASIIEFEKFSSVKASRRRRTPRVVHRIGGPEAPTRSRIGGQNLTNVREMPARPARSPSSRSGSAACQRRRRPGTASSGSTVGDALGSDGSGRWGYARLDLTRCGTSTPPSSACSTGHAPLCTPSSTTPLDGCWRGAWPTRSHQVTAWPCCSRAVGTRPV
jgi:hypothetical protein